MDILAIVLAIIALAVAADLSKTARHYTAMVSEYTRRMDNLIDQIQPHFDKLDAADNLGKVEEKEYDTTDYSNRKSK